MRKQTTPKDRKFLKLALGGFSLILLIIVLIGLLTKPDVPYT
ncbi:MAG TPA: hypothetical protein VF695_01805 [Sphingomonas sp.]|jgi:hypothetical protein